MTKDRRIIYKSIYLSATGNLVLSLGNMSKDRGAIRNVPVMKWIVCQS